MSDLPSVGEQEARAKTVTRLSQQTFRDRGAL